MTGSYVSLSGSIKTNKDKLILIINRYGPATENILCIPVFHSEEERGYNGAINSAMCMK